jgi:hypothetical protein
MAVCVVVELEEVQGCVFLWIEYCWLCSVRVGRGTLGGTFCELVTAGFVVLECEEGQGLV